MKYDTPPAALGLPFSTPGKSRLPLLGAEQCDAPCQLLGVLIFGPIAKLHNHWIRTILLAMHSSVPHPNSSQGTFTYLQINLAQFLFQRAQKIHQRDVPPYPSGSAPQLLPAGCLMDSPGLWRRNSQLPPAGEERGCVKIQQDVLGGVCRGRSPWERTVLPLHN